MLNTLLICAVKTPATILFLIVMLTLNFTNTITFLAFHMQRLIPFSLSDSASHVSVSAWV